jgi:hypothetical protein
MPDRQPHDRKGRTPRQARARATVDAILLAAAHILRTEGEARRTDLPLRAAVRAAVDRIVAMHRIDPALHAHLSADAHPLGAEEMREFRARMQAYLEEHAASLRPLDAALASYIGTRVMEALLHGTAHDEPAWLAHPRFAEEVTELLVRYLEP